MGYGGYEYTTYSGGSSRPGAIDYSKEWADQLNQPVRYKPATGAEQTGTTTQETTTEFTGKRPEYEKPVWDEGEIRKISRKVQAPNIRQLRQQVQRVVAQQYENPNVRRMMLQNALQGYGIGLGKILAEGETQARSEYARKYSFDVQEAMAKYQAAWGEYMASATRRTTSTTKGTTQQTFGATTPKTWRDWGGPAVLNPYLGGSGSRYRSRQFPSGW